MDDCYRYVKKALIQKFEKSLRLTFASYRLEKFLLSVTVQGFPAFIRTRNKTRSYQHIRFKIQTVTV